MMTIKGGAQRRSRWLRIIDSVEESLGIPRLHYRPFMRSNGLDGCPIGRIDREYRDIDTTERCSTFDRGLDPRFGPKMHAFCAALVDRARFVLQWRHTTRPSRNISTLLGALKRDIPAYRRIMRMKRGALLLGALLATMAPAPAQASKCEAGTIFNPITKVRWNCIFPITIGGVRVGSFDTLSKELDAQSASKPLCACRKGATFWFGVKVSFWSPNRMIDVVTEPGCMMALGADLLPTGGRLQGSQSGIADGTNSQKMFAQMHYYIAPVWKMLDMFTDLPCIEDTGFDVAMITEVLPTWQSGTLGAIIQPEGILFGNPAAGLACMADSAAAAAGKVIDPLFWCMGSWGATYPVAGDIHFGDSVEAWAGLAARGTFMMGRLGALTISSADGCSFKAQPIWTKSRYKLQIMEPVKGGQCVNIGRPGALWSSGKHAPGKDNAQFMSFEKVICCAGISTP